MNPGGYIEGFCPTNIRKSPQRRYQSFSNWFLGSAFLERTCQFYDFQQGIIGIGKRK